MVRKILRSGDPKLREKSKPVTKVDSKVLELIKDLKETLAIQKDPEGVGLAAPQIGKSLRIFVANYKNIDRFVINPEILETKEEGTKTKKGAKEKGKQEILEGCLSLPNYYGPLKRINFVKVKYLNEEGKEIVEEFKDFYAQIILHEVDHLNGILFLDRLLEQKQPLYKLDGDKWEEVDI